MGNTFYYQWEADFMVWLQSVLGSAGIAISSFLSTFGETLVMVLMLGFVYWCWDKKTGMRMGLSMFFGAIAFPIAKNIALRRRPYMDIPGIQCFKPVEKGEDIMNIAAQGYSFPSGHSTNAASSWGSLAYYFREQKLLTALGIVLPLLVGFSRVALGNHYPTDVLVGWALGYAGVFLVPVIIKKVQNKTGAYIITILVCALGVIFCRSNDYFTSFGMITGALLGNLFEEKYVHFEMTRKPLYCILRVAVGGGLFLALNELWKLPCSPEFLSSASMGQFLFRYARYAINVFLLIGVYPALFKKFEKPSQSSEAA